MKVDAKTADALGWFTAIVKKPFHAEWQNYGMPNQVTDYKAGEKIKCVAWKPEGMSPCKAAGHPDMWLSWKNLANCEYSPEDEARLERLTSNNSCAKNAKFKVGEYVTSKERPYLGKGRITDEVDFNQYLVKFSGGAQDLFEGSDLVAANACAKNYAYSPDPIKLMIQYAKREDYGGIMDFTNPGEAESMGLYPADVVKRVYAKASKYYAGGRNMATPAQTQELVNLISQLRVKGINSCAKNGVRSTNAAVNAALNGCGTAKNAWGDESQVNGLITKMLGLIKQIKPIAGQLYDTAFELDDAGSVWLDKNKDSKNAQKVRVAVARANKVMKRLVNFASGLDF